MSDVNRDFPTFPRVNPTVKNPEKIMASWLKMADLNEEKINDLVTFIDLSNEKSITYDPATHGACLSAIDQWTQSDVISVQFAASFSGNPESLEFVARIRTFLDQFRPNIFNLLLEAPRLSMECLSLIGNRLLNELDTRVQVSILVTMPTPKFAKAFIQWRKRGFRCNHLFLAKLGRIELSSSFWESFQLGDDLAVVTIEDIDGEETAGQIFEKFYRPQSSVQLLRLGNIKNVPKEFFQAGLILAGAFDTLPLGLQIKVDGEKFYASMRGEDRSKTIEDRIKALFHADETYHCKHLKMMFIGTGGKAAGKTSTIRSLCGKSFKPDLPPTQCAEVVAQVQVPTDQAMQENAATQWTVYSMKKAVLRGYDAVTLKRSGALFAIYDFATNTQLFNPVLNDNCIVMLCINLMDMKSDAGTEVKKLVETLKQIIRDAPHAPVIIIGTHSDEYPSPAALKDLDKKISMQVRKVANLLVQPNATQGLIFFPLENSRGEMNVEQLGPIKIAVGGLVRRAEDTIDQRNEAGEKIAASAPKNSGGIIGLLVYIDKLPNNPLPLMHEYGKSYDAYFLNMIMKTDLNTFFLERHAIIAKAMGFTLEQIANTVKYYKAIGLIIYISFGETENDTLNTIMVLKPNWLYQSFAKLLYDPMEKSKVYDVPLNLFDDVDKYEGTGQATSKVLKALLDGMKEYEKEYVIELAMHWNLITQIADSPEGDAEYLVHGMMPP